MASRFPLTSSAEIDSLSRAFTRLRGYRFRRLRLLISQSMIVGCSVHLQSGLLARATDRRVTHVIRSCNVREHFACLSASNGFPTLLAGQLWLPAKDNSPRLCTLAPLAGTSPDQLALELGETAQNSQHQATMRRRGVSPSISQRLKPRPFFRDRSQEIEEIAGRPCQSI